MKQGDPRDMQERGTGRTYRQLEKLQPGDVFLVHHQNARRQATDMLHQHFGGKSVLVKVAHGVHPDFLRGMRSGTWIEVDHWLWEMWESSQTDSIRREKVMYQELMREINSRSERDNDRHEDPS